MKRIALLAFVLLCGSAVGQRIEKMIHLGDTWRLPAAPVAFAYDSRDKTVFIGGAGSDSVVVLDERTIEPLEWIDVGAPVKVLVYSKAFGKVYCLQDSSVSVYDASTRTRLKTIGTSIQPNTACLDSEDGKLYIGNKVSSLVVIDCSLDSVVAVLSGAPGSICYVPGWHRVYYSDQVDSSVVAVDCHADTLLARVRIGARPTALCYNSVNNRVYVLRANELGPTGIDVSSNEVVSNGHRLLSTFVFSDPSSNRLYGMDGPGDVAVYDCSTDSIVAAMITNGGIGMMMYNPADNKIYAAGYYLHIFDLEGDTMTERLISVPNACALASTSGENLVFLAGRGDPELMVVDGKSDRLIRELSSSYDFGQACADPGIGKVFCLSGGPAGLAVVDGRSGEVGTFILTGRWPDGLYGDTVNHVLYVREEPSFITAVDALGDSVINTIRLDCWDMPPVVICPDTRDRKIYVTKLGSSLMVFNWSLEKLVDSICLGEQPCTVVYHEPTNRVYCGTETGVLQIDCSTDEVIQRLDLDCRVSQLCFGTAEDMLYCVADTQLVTVDCSSAEVVGRAPTPHRGGRLYYNSVSDKIYRVCDSSVCVYRGTDGHFLASLATGHLGGLAFDPRTNTMLCPSIQDSSVIVIDGRSDRIAAKLAIGAGSYAIGTDPCMPLAFVCGGAEITVIRKDTVPVEFGVTAAPDPVGGTVVRGKLYYTGGAGAFLMNPAGRKVLDLHPGANDVSGLVPGVYFVRDPQLQTVRKVVITR